MANDYWEIALKNKSMDEKLDIIEGIEEANCFTEDDLKILDYLSQDENDEVRAKIAEILVLLNSPIAENILIKLLTDKAELVRVNACDSLSVSNSIEVLKHLKGRIVKDRSSLVRGFAALSIADIAINTNYDMEELSIFFRYVLEKEKVHWVKISFYKALYVLGDESYLYILLSELSSRLYRNRCAVVSILDEIASSKNIAVIKTALAERLKVEKTVAVKSKIEKTFQNMEAKNININQEVQR